MAEEIINDVDENGFEIIDTPIHEALDLSNLATFLKEAIATDTAIEYTIPLNDDSSFINAHYYDPDKGEDFIIKLRNHEGQEFQFIAGELARVKENSEIIALMEKAFEVYISGEGLQSLQSESSVPALVAKEGGRGSPSQFGMGS